MHRTHPIGDKQTFIITLQLEVEGCETLINHLQDIEPVKWDEAIQHTARILLPIDKQIRYAYTNRVDKTHPMTLPKGSWLGCFVWKWWKKLKGEYDE
jgi:hypothetical protein